MAGPSPNDYVSWSLGAAANQAQAVGSIGSLISANSAPGSLDLDPIGDIMFRRPNGPDQILSVMSAQTLFELGVPIGVIEEEMLMRQITANRAPITGRNAMNHLARARAAYATGDTKLGDKHLKTIRTALGRAGVSADVVNGQVQLNFHGPQGEMINQLRARSAQQAQNFDNRMAAMTELNRGLAGVRVPTPESIGQSEQQAAAYLNSYLDRRQIDETERINAQSNMLGISPGGQLADLNTAIGDERFRIQSGGALERALKLIQGTIASQAGAMSTIQQGLQPSMGNSTLAGINQNSQNDLSALNMGLQYAIADTQASAARSAGVANAWQDFGTNMSNSFLQAAAMQQGGGMGGMMGSSQLQQGLGGMKMGGGR